jgi:hypothetical protein
MFDELDRKSGPSGYIAKPDADQKTASNPNVQHLRESISVAVHYNSKTLKLDADRLRYDDRVYIPQFGLRAVDDSGSLHGNLDQIDVWRGAGDVAMLNTVRNFKNKTADTCLKVSVNP